MRPSEPAPRPVWGSRATWQIRIRWLVPPAIAVGLALGHALGWRVPAPPVLAVAAFVLAYNTLFRLVLDGRLGDGAVRTWLADRAAVLQVALDYGVTFALVGLTGGILSPVALFLLFHVVFAAILLPPTTAWLAALVASGGLAGIAAAQSLGGPGTTDVFVTGGVTPPPAFVAGYLLSFTATALVLAVAVAAIVSRLRQETARALQANAALLEERERLTLQVVHNLRAPLAAAVGLLELVTSGTVGPVDDRPAGYVERAARRLRGMADALGDLLRLASHAAHPVSAFESVDLAAVARQVARMFAERAREAGLALRIEVPPDGVTVAGHERSLAEMLENLVSNAIKYTPPDGIVEVAVTGPRDGWARVTVQDTGIGVPSAEQARLFQEFFRASNAKGVDPSGTGLGLSIVRQIAHQHGGEVAFESEEGVGTTVTVRLPAADGRR